MSDADQDLRVTYPRWLLILFIPGWIIILLTFFFYTRKFIEESLSVALLLKSSFLFIITLGGIWVILGVLFYSVTATRQGILATNLFGKDRFLPWHEIVEVRRPRFGIPQEITYVISQDKAKLLLFRSMKKYSTLIKIIKARASNLARCEF